MLSNNHEIARKEVWTLCLSRMVQKNVDFEGRCLEAMIECADKILGAFDERFVDDKGTIFSRKRM